MKNAFFSVIKNTDEKYYFYKSSFIRFKSKITIYII